MKIATKKNYIFEVKGKTKNMKKLIAFSIVFASIIILSVIFSGCTNRGDNAVTEEKTQEISVNIDKETDIYQFAYKKSVLNLSRAKFDEYNLTDENLRKFCDKMEQIYVLFEDFFLVHNLPEVFTYNSVTKEYMESVGVFVEAYSVGTENSTYYVEGWLEGYLKDIDKGLPSIVAHEVGHLYTFWADDDKGIIYNGSKYVWDFEVFAVIATEYILSQPDFILLNASGGIYSPITVTQERIMAEDWYDEWVKNYQGFIHFKIASINEKYGYDTMHEVLVEMIKKDSSFDSIEMFNLFFDIYSEKTGENLKEEYFTQEELNTVYENINQYWERSSQ